MLVTLLLVQAVAGPYLPSPARPRSDTPCPPAGDTTDVVVCARDPDTYRLRRLPVEAEHAIPRAELRLGSARLAAEAEQATLAGGAQSQRLMMRLTLPLGKKRTH